MLSSPEPDPLRFHHIDHGHDLRIGIEYDHKVYHCCSLIDNCPVSSSRSVVGPAHSSGVCVLFVFHRSSVGPPVKDE
jgi:hypothetical protein